MKLNDIFPSKYLKAADLDGIETVATISGLQMEPMKDQDGNEETKPVLYFTDLKPMVMNLTNGRAIESLYGDDTDVWAGNQVTLYTAEVSAFGKVTQAIRVRDAKAIAARTKKPASVAQTTNGNGADTDRKTAITAWNAAAKSAKNSGHDDLVELYRPASTAEVVHIVKCTKNLTDALANLYPVPDEVLA